MILVCDDTPYVKVNEVTGSLLQGREMGEPYKGAKPHYLLDVDGGELIGAVALELEKIRRYLSRKRKKSNRIEPLNKRLYIYNAEVEL